jgi:hypothetical protein
VEFTEDIEFHEYVAFGGNGYRSRTPLTQSCSGTLTGLRSVMVPYNLTRSFDALASAGTPFMLEIALTGGGTWRGWIVITSLSNKVGADGVYEGTVAFAAAPILGTGQDEYAVYGWT